MGQNRPIRVNEGEKAPNLPGGGPVVKTQDEAQVPVVNKNAREVSGVGLNVQSDGPGRIQSRAGKLEDEWLGNLDKISFEDFDKDSDEGAGEYCVVLVDYLSGADGQGFVKGDVRRISKFINGYGDQARIKEARSNAKRLFDLKAIRFADSIEAQHLHVEVSTETETEAVQRERALRIEAERENESLKKQLQAAQAAQMNASPIPGSELGLEAQQGTGGEADQMPDF